MIDQNTSLLVVSAHAADFVWRGGGTIAKYVKHGARVKLIILSYGARGESNELWNIEGQTLENVGGNNRSDVGAERRFPSRFFHGTAQTDAKNRQITFHASVAKGCFRCVKQ